MLLLLDRSCWHSSMSVLCCEKNGAISCSTVVFLS